MEKEDAEMLLAHIERLTATQFAQRRLLGLLFAANPDAMAGLQKFDQSTLEAALLNQPNSDEFNAHVEAEFAMVREQAERWLRRGRTG